MRRPLLALWITLLAVLLAGSRIQRAPLVGHSTHQLVAGSEAPLGHALPVALQLAPLHLRSPADRQGSHPWELLPPHEIAGVTPSTFFGSLDQEPNGGLGESARHFPLFPTGPPSHS